MATLGLSKVFILDKYFAELQKFWETERKLQGEPRLFLVPGGTLETHLPASNCCLDAVSFSRRVLSHSRDVSVTLSWGTTGHRNWAETMLGSVHLNLQRALASVSVHARDGLFLCPVPTGTQPASLHEGEGHEVPFPIPAIDLIDHSSRNY